MKFLITMLASCLLAVAAYADDVATMLERGQYRQARAVLEQRIKSNPKDAQAHYQLSKVRQAFGDVDAANQLAQKAVDIDPKNADYRTQLGITFGRQAQRAGMLRQMGLARSFRREIEEALRLNPNQVDARFAMMHYHWQAPGIVGGDKNKSRQAPAEIARINALQGAFAEAELAELEKNAAGIEAAFKKAVSVDPKSYAAHRALANYYAGQKQAEPAEKHARDAQRLDPHRVGAYTLLAMIYATQGRMADLDKLLAEAEKNVAHDLNPFYQAARILYTEGKELQKAEEYMRKYLRQEPEAGSPDLAAAHWRLGLILEKQGRKNEAIAELQKAVQKRPGMKEAQEDLKRLKAA